MTDSCHGRRVLRAIRRTPERLTHPLRRTRAERVGAAARGPGLGLCHGNICRSPYAEARLRQLLAGRDADVASAGFIGPGRPAAEFAQQSAAARGIDLSRHRSQLITPALAQAAGLVVVMNASQRAELRSRYAGTVPVVILGDLDPKRIDAREVTDPFGRDAACFAAVFDRLDRCLARLAGLLGTASAGR
ncbi:MAG: hypothetical protein FIB01_08575 [Gemmatimonadetes bacterium]|nr:hypothetical protein [Gemmatimonadota bacterium]